jgi:hypothetical protein
MTALERRLRKIEQLYNARLTGEIMGRVLKLLITRVRREYRTRSDSQRGQSQYRA